MSLYTITINQLLKNGFDFGLQEYPIYKEEHRLELNSKILNHFKYCEIGFETPTLFKDRLNERMGIIMPYYNQLYKSCDIEYNPLFNIDLTETYESQGGVVSKSENNSNGVTKDILISENKSKNINTDVPQTLTSFDVATDGEKGIYMTDGNYSNEKNTNTDSVSNENKSKSNDSQNTNQTYTKKTKGSSAGLAFSTAIKKDRETYINIDQMIIEELEDLFISLW